VNAEILAIGSELLTPSRTETNALVITRSLQESGITVIARTTVADDPSVLEASFRTALGRAEIVIATGGLGPTADDLTREAAAAALSLPLRRDEGLLEALKARFASFNRVMAAVNAKQADLIEGARVLPNPRGTAPGQAVEAGGRILILLPGPPREMEPMFETEVLPVLRARAGGRALRTRVVRIASMGESDVEQLVAPVYTTFANPTTTILGGAGEVELRFTAEGSSPEEAEARIEPLAAAVRKRLGHRIYSEDGRSLPEVVADLLRSRGLTLALAESCTGGLLAARLTELPGASAFLLSSFVTYSNEAKVTLLGVPPALLAEKGAVSDEVARAMASGVHRVSGASVGVGITGIAGPDGGTPDKPVGLVFLALSGAAGDWSRRAQFPGDRERVRLQATQAALDMVRRGLLGLGSS
jgi:nicotinamide-nucleotide amidase